MELLISNNIEIVDPTYEIERYCEEHLIIDNPDYIIANRLGRYVGKMEKKLQLYVKSGNRFILPFGCLNDIWNLCGKCIKYTLGFSPFKGNKLSGNIILYDYQQKGLQALLRGKNGVLEAPCGSGKTQIGLQLIKEIGGKALWLTHTKKLLEQSKERAKTYFTGDFGTITEGKVNIGKDITFATVQTMRMLDPSVYKDEFDMVIVDECHHCVGTPTKVMQFYKVVSNLNCRYKYGLSATLKRADKMTNCIYYLLGKKLYTITEQDVGEKIIKAKHIRVNWNKEYDLDDYCQSDGMIDYNALLNLLSEDQERNQMICNEVINYHQQKKMQLVLCARLAQIDSLYKMLSKTGMKVNIITGRIKDKDRDYKGDVILATFAIAKEGLDIPELDVVHFATPQKDETTTKQSAGRVERNYEGKARPLVIDYVDTDIDYCLNCFTLRRRILAKSKKN